MIIRQMHESASRYSIASIKNECHIPNEGKGREERRVPGADDSLCAPQRLDHEWRAYLLTCIILFGGRIALVESRQLSERKCV